MPDPNYMNQDKPKKKLFDSNEPKDQNQNQRVTATEATPVKAKKSKTFTGCFTCRSRKIRCDIKKPYCNNCTKSGLICAGYDIKLRWSLPLQFSSDTGNAISSQVVFKHLNKEGVEDDSPANVEFFQRRHVGFVKWDAKRNCKPYETYEEMDRDLGILHNSGNDNFVNIEGKTKLLGPFGVFRGQSLENKRNHDDDDIKKLKKMKTDDGSYNNSVKVTSLLVKNPLTPNTANSADESAPHDQLWLSNELRDDALLTAAALNGDTQFLDFMNNLSSNTNNILPPNPNMSSSSPNFNNNNYNFSTNQNDFLNLVFHRHHNQTISASNNSNSNANNTSASNSNNQSTNNMATSNLLNESETSNISIDPTNQHLFYSNYNNYYYNNPYQLNENLEIHLHASRLSNNNDEESTDIVEGDNSNTTQMPSSIMCIVQRPLEPKLGYDISFPNPSSSKVGLPTTALQVQPLTRYLLNYYVTQVADLMTVIPLTENPWKTIYFPRALMAIGELSALGQTSTAKNALLNALLAVSAFNLQSKFPKNSEPMKYYLNLGIRLRNQATLFVKQLLGSDTDTQSGVEHCVSNEKYKDVLCAVMSMISVDLVWGTMQDTNIYIKWCGKVISTKMINKKKLSSKARILHRIFSSLKLIQDSTCLDLENIKDNYELTNEKGYDVNGDKFGQSRPNSNSSVGKGKINFIVNSLTSKETNSSTSIKNTSPLFVNKKLINTKKNDENFATDALYGLPNSLILLFSETVQLLRTKIYHSQIYHTLPNNFTQKVNELDEKLKNWKLDWKLYDGEEDDDLNNIDLSENADDNKKFYSPMHETTYHHILSFYHALTIYYNRLIREVSPLQVQTKVEKTLYHLNSIQKLITKGEAAIIPLFWQGFIAGCEAISLNLQMGFKKWGADIAQYLGSYWGARQIMLEVWRRKRMNEPRDDWVSVVQDWEMNLMLN